MKDSRFEDSGELDLNINGEQVHIRTRPTRTLLDLLREELSLTGTKCGCGIGECGACTVLIEGRAVNACLILVGQLNGKNVRTIEGLSKNGRLHPVQRAFITEHAVQCGYCTSGLIMSTVALLEQVDRPTDEQIKHALAGNLCRCTGYSKIIRAVQRAAEELSEGRVDG